METALVGQAAQALKAPAQGIAQGQEIVLAKVPDITEHLADQVARIVRSIRQLDLKKAPSVSETLDWARTLMLLNIDNIDFVQLYRQTLQQRAEAKKAEEGDAPKVN